MVDNRRTKDLELYRSIQEAPAEFEGGFGWTTVIGIFFCGLIMMPGGIYLSLMTGGNLASAASWVTVILFMEIARRALKPLSKQNLSLLLHAAFVMMTANIFIPGGPLGWLVYRAYLSTSEAARDAGMVGSFPTWIVPPPGSDALLGRTFFHKDWMIPVAIVFFSMLVSFIQKYTLGYLFFRLTSDVEKLPFPRAAIGAQGTLALAESESRYTEADEAAGKGKAGMRKKSTRWRVFSLGVIIGIGFGIIQVGIPAVSGLFLSKPFFLIPQPFVDTTTLTEGFLPATPTGMVLDIGVIFIGFVLPFWVIMGTFMSILITVVANPILHSLGILHTWQPGMNTVNTTFSNSIDFWMSFGIGSALAIAIISVYSAIRDLMRKTREKRLAAKEGDAEIENPWATPPGRGDYPLWFAGLGYFVSTAALVGLCIFLLPKTWGIVFFLLFYTFLFVPFISYVNARLMGITGQRVEIPYIKEMGFILSGAKGIDIWLAPIPAENFGAMAQAFRTNEIIGVRFRSLIKTDMVALPILFILSFLFWSFIWKSDAVPSEVFPAAQINWELRAKNDILLMSSTFVAPNEDPANKRIGDSEFMKAIHPKVIGGAFGFTMILYTILSVFGLPVTLVYGMIRGFGQVPHTYMLEVFGALLARYYLHKKYGPQNFLRAAPTLMAGYFTGVGLIGMATIAMRLMKAAISSAPF
jgi:hypothetical protein